MILRKRIQKKKMKERKIPYDFTHMWNLRNKTNDHGRKKDKPRKSLLTIENTRREWGGEWLK